MRLTLCIQPSSVNNLHNVLFTSLVVVAARQGKENYYNGSAPPYKTATKKKHQPTEALCDCIINLKKKVACEKEKQRPTKRLERSSGESEAGFCLKSTKVYESCDGAFIAFSFNSPLGVLWGQNGNSFQPTRREERDYAN
ncbi:hypothetical protein TNCV_4652731 [Trichonephila clavipes]|nr:hypothetical protein TNCV_4652731 [Trichonephila clavipes]